MSGMESFIEGVVAMLILAGSAFAFIGSVGLARLPNFFARMHGPSKATTLGIGGVTAASALFFSVSVSGLSVHELLIILFIAITTPISSHLLGKAALHRGASGEPER